MIRSKEMPTADQLQKELNRVRRTGQRKTVLRNTVYMLAGVAAISILIAMLWVPVLNIYGSSMTPSLHEGQVVAAVKTKHFTAGDIVAFYYGNKLLVKRYIAGPGDWVNIDKDGNVFVNSALLQEPYVSEKALGQTDIEYPYQVPEGRFFVMGDHRTLSVDSRSTAIGCISEEQLVGKIVFCIWPLSDIGTVK